MVRKLNSLNTEVPDCRWLTPDELNEWEQYKIGDTVYVINGPAVREIVSIDPGSNNNPSRFATIPLSEEDAEYVLKKRYGDIPYI